MEAPKRRTEEESLADLLRQIREGSLQAFDRFYEEAAPFVMGLGCKMLGDRMEAEDVCHDVLMSVIAKPERYDPARGSVEAWLAVLAKSRCLDRLRKRKRVVLESAANAWPEPRGSDAGDLERRVLNRLEREALRRAWGDLPGAQRQTLAAAFYDYRSQRELAENWKVPLGTVKSRVRYGLSHLRKAMERLGWAEGGGRGE
ncbi:sigma-70 family RNA polymerase sigma factor [Cohnella caldifontis]|uniref:sigma-70 family RNA polymerase sigma factor n=1 Tax=Cohnella caldifontis TaxID=3027471 RepID=UPI0023EA9445|nr:sigma-70 family RNA polymerase sigma factor [Cohnella sp. YIM B05605]